MLDLGLFNEDIILPQKATILGKRSISEISCDMNENGGFVTPKIIKAKFHADYVIALHSQEKKNPARGRVFHFLLFVESGLLAPPAEAESGQAEAQESESAGFGDGCDI